MHRLNRSVLFCDVMQRIANSLPTFRHYVLIPSSRINKCKKPKEEVKASNHPRKE